MQPIFNVAGGDENVLETQYKKVIQKEFFEGEIGSSSDGPINLFLEKGLAHPVSVVHLSTPNRITYRRTHRHIQENHVDVYVVWLIKRGGFKLTRSSSGTVTVGEGQFLIYDSATPFFAELVCDDRGMHDSLQAVIPAHMFREHFAELSNCTLALETRAGPTQMAADLLGMMADQGHLASRPLGDAMVGALLQALGEAISDRRNDTGRKTIFDRRLEEIEQFVMRNLTSRDLSANSIAESCNISPRYLCYILKAAGYTFSGLVWDKRLEKAREWLVSPRMQTYLVHEIAGMAGYKSAAHFSRAFKTACGCTPSEYRRRMMAEGEAKAEEAFPEPMGVMH